MLLAGMCVLMAAVVIEDDFWRCECGHTNYEDEYEVDDCPACGFGWGEKGCE